jgi:hypothetical protein
MAGLERVPRRGRAGRRGGVGITLVLSLLVLAVGVLFYGLSPESQEDGGREDVVPVLFRGTVVDLGLEPVAGARIEVEGRPGAWAVSDLDGEFELSCPPLTGGARLTVFSDGCRPALVDVPGYSLDGLRVVPVPVGTDG